MDILNLAVTLSVTVTPFLVLFNEKVIRRFKKEHAKVFVLAIDEVAASVRTELGVRTILRGTLYSSSLKLTEAVLEGPGQPAHETREVLERFQRYDEQLLQRQCAVFRDETKLIQTTREAAEKLKRLLKEDSQSGPADKAAS